MKVLIVIVALLAFGAVVGAVVVGSETYEGVVTENPYEKGLRWDEERDARLASGLEVVVHNPRFFVGDNELEVTLEIDDPTRLPDQIGLQMTRPHTDADDFSVVLSRQAPGARFTGRTEIIRPGNWLAIFHVRLDGKDLDFQQSITVHASVVKSEQEP